MTTPVSRPPTKGPYAYTPPTGDGWKMLRWGRIGLTLLLIPLSVSTFRHEYGHIAIVGDINLAVHETGHYLFMPFGEMMTILGGSLFEVLFPLIFVWYFIWGKEEHRDRHAAMVCLWWASTALLNVSIYAGDARARQLMLLTGETAEDDPESHDWRNLLVWWGLINKDTVIAARMRFVAVLMCIVAIGYGLYLAWNSGPTEKGKLRT